jgi:hypothetical protein
MMTREELAGMTDDEILAHYRNKHGNPYMSLGVAKEMHHAVFKNRADPDEVRAPGCRRQGPQGRSTAARG